MFSRFALFACLGLAVVSASGAKDLYKTVTPDGRIVFTDKPPEENRIQETFRYEDLPQTPVKAAPPKSEQKPAAAPAAAAASNQVILYTTSWCPYCRKAKDYLRARGIAYQEIDTETGVG